MTEDDIADVHRGAYAVRPSDGVWLFVTFILGLYVVFGLHHLWQLIRGVS